MASSNIKSEALTGFAAAAAYDEGRPSYSPEAVEQLLQKLEVSGIEGAKILDLAAGTGKFTELLSARPERFVITAVEPHNDMRKQLAAKDLRGVEVLKGTAESMQDIADGTFAAVVAAQASHPPHWTSYY
jgi:ubiquinone/menaquinone biosynthesis C-methylase UbiE